MISTVDDTNVVVDTPKILRHPSYIQIAGYKVPATFDFTDLPPRYHQIVYSCIQAGGTHIMGDIEPYDEKEHEKIKTEIKEYKDDSILGYLLQPFFWFLGLFGIKK